MKNGRQGGGLVAGLARTAAAAAVLAAVLAVLCAFLLPEPLRDTALDTVRDAVSFLPWSESGRITGEDWSRVVAYVPLDDRTDNLEDVELLAEASGWQILLPPRDWFRTALDGQPRNADGTPYGNREALLEWVREQDSKGCDRFILSLDQLFSGGLVNSRSVAESWVLTFSDGTVLDEAEAFRQYILPLAEDPGNRVYLFDSVVRLSPTVEYKGVRTEEYYALREYGMVERPALSGDSLTLDNVFSRYPFAADGVTAAEDALGSGRFRAYLTEDLLDTYLRVRQRKLSLLDSFLTALESVPGDRVQLLIGIDDSSNTANIQYNELRYLESRLGENSRLMAGLDSLARLLLGRLARDEAGYTIKAAVRYVGGTQGIPSSEFDLYTLEQVVDLHLDLFGAERVPPEEAELQFVVMTAPDDPAKAEAYREELLSLLESSAANHIPTVLDEASNNAYGDALEQALLERVSFAGLTAYAGKYDQANVTGAAFAMGFARYLYLKCGPDRDVTDSRAPDRSGGTNGADKLAAEQQIRTERKERADQAQLRQIANSMALTEYILHVRAPLNTFVSDLGLNVNNMLFADGQREAVLGELETLFRPDLRRVCENLRGSQLQTGVSPWTEQTVDDVEITDLYFPWNRTFELAFCVKTNPGGIEGNMERKQDGERQTGSSRQARGIEQGGLRHEAELSGSG